MRLHERRAGKKYCASGNMETVHVRWWWSLQVRLSGSWRGETTEVRREASWILRGGSSMGRWWLGWRGEWVDSYGCGFKTRRKSVAASPWEPEGERVSKSEWCPLLSQTASQGGQPSDWCSGVIPWGYSVSKQKGREWGKAWEARPLLHHLLRTWARSAVTPRREEDENPGECGAQMDRKMTNLEPVYLWHWTSRRFGAPMWAPIFPFFINILEMFKHLKKNSIFHHSVPTITDPQPIPIYLYFIHLLSQLVHLEVRSRSNSF